MSSPKLMVIKTITLICLERRLGSDVPLSKDLMLEVLSFLPIEDATVEVDWGKQAYNQLKEYAVTLASTQPTDFPHESEILQQIKVIVRDDTFLYDAVAQTLETSDKEDTSGNVDLITSLKKTLYRFIKDKKVETIGKRYLNELQFRSHEIPDVTQHFIKMGEELQPLLEAAGADDDPAMMGSVDFDDLDSLEEDFKKAQVALSTDGALKPGWQAMRRFLGACEGFKRGECVLMGALKHNAKSTIMMCLLVQIAMYNKPVLRNPSKIPLLVFISFENEIAGNIKFIYEYIYSNLTGQKPDFNNVSSHDLSKYVVDFFASTGYKVKMYRFDPSDFTYARLITFLEQLQHQGHEIIGLWTDYMNMMSKRGIETSAAGDDIRLLARRIRNYTSPRAITWFTPHQLSSEAQKLARENADGFAKQVANNAYWDGCVRLGHEPDLEFVMHIVKRFKRSYLDFYRGKHRYTVTPEEYQGFTLPFDDIKTLPMDIDKEDISVNLDQSSFDMGDDLSSLV